jgi:arabinosyltransferase
MCKVWLVNANELVCWLLARTSDQSCRVAIPADVSNFLIGAMDWRSATRLRELEASYFIMFDQDALDSGLGQDDFGWGSGKFHKMGRQKINLLQTFLSFELDIVLCDTDTVWIHDPTDYFNSFPAADVLASSDHMAPTLAVADDGLELPEAVHSAMNIGVMLFRHSSRAREFVLEWVKKLDENPKLWDQKVFNDLARAGFSGKTHGSNSRLFYGFHGKLVMGILPVSSFASGHTYHVQHLAQVSLCSTSICSTYGHTRECL